MYFRTVGGGVHASHLAKHTETKGIWRHARRVLKIETFPDEIQSINIVFMG